MTLRLLTVSILLFVSFQQSIAQSYLDSLRQLATSVQDEALVDVHNKIARRVFTMEVDEAIVIANEALSISEKINYTQGKLESLQIIASYYSVKSENDTAISILNKALSLAEKNEMIGQMAKINTLLGSSYIRQYQYQNAVKVLIRSLELSEESYHPETRVTTLMNLSVTRVQLGQYEQSDVVLKEALQIATENNLELLKGQIYGNLGILEFDRANYSLAEDYFKNGLESFEKLSSERMITNTLLQLGRVNKALGQYEHAISKFDQALGSKSISERMEVSLKRHKSMALMEMNRFSEVERLIAEILPKTKALSDEAILKDIYEIGYQIAEFRKDYELAYQYHQEWSAIKDTLTARNNTRELKRLTKEFDLNKLQSQMESEQQLADLEIRNRNYFLVFVSISTGLLIVLLLLNRSKIRSKLEVSQTRQLLLEREMELTNLKLMQSQETISSFEKTIEGNSQISHSKQRLSKLLMSPRILAQDWVAFKVAFDDVYPDFNTKLEEYELTFNDQRLLWLLKLGLSNKEIAQVLSITPKSVVKAKSRLSQRLNLVSPRELEALLKHF